METPRTFTGAGVTVVADTEGLLLKRRWYWPRRIWWEEVRQVEWLAHGRVRLWLAEGAVMLDQRLPDLRDLVATIEAAASEVRASHRVRLKGDSVSRLFGLQPRQLLTLPTAAGPRRVAALAGSVVNGLASWVLDFILIFGLYCAFGVCTDAREPVFVPALAAALAVPLGKLRFAEHPELDPGRALWSWLTRLAGAWRRAHPDHQQAGELHPRTVAVSSRGVWFDGRCRPWSQVRTCELDAFPGAPTARVTLTGDGWEASFRLWLWGAQRVCAAFRVLADLTRHDFVGTGGEPAPDTALSLARLDGAAHEAERGVSLTGEERH